MLALAGGTIYVDPSATPLRRACVLVDGAKITAVGPDALVEIPRDATTLDCSGNTIAAGFWNSHVHFFERKWANVANIPRSELSAQLEEMLTRYGFAYAFDLGSMWHNTRELRRRIDSDEVAGPRIFSTGEGLLPRGALPSEAVLNAMGVMNFPAPEIESALQAALAARNLLKDGVDGIKLFASSPRSASLGEDVMEAAATEAHKDGKPVFVHPNSGDDVLRALRAGVDVIAHTAPSSGPWGEEILSAAVDCGAALTPTLTLWKYFLRHDRQSRQSDTVSTALRQLQDWRKAGGDVLFGTDLGAVDYDPTQEYRLMSEAGMSFHEILASLTTAPAARFGKKEETGRVAAGYAADLVVIGGDPADDISALGDVQYTLRGGRIIYDGAFK